MISLGMRGAQIKKKLSTKEDKGVDNYSYMLYDK